MGRVRDERRRQIQLGYTLAHDVAVGIPHLLKWSVKYALKGKFVKAAAILVAAFEVVKSL